MSLTSDLEALLDPTPRARRVPAAMPVPSRHDHSPRAELVDFDGRRGELTVHGDTPVHDWQEVLQIALPPGFDPEDYVIVGNPRVTSHTRLETGGWENVQAWWKIQFARKDVLTEEEGDEDLERLHDELSRWKLPKRRTALAGDAPFVITLADWQIGQLDQGGTAHTVARLKQVFAGIRDRVRDLRKIGVPLGTAVVAGGGDLFEGCDGFYAMQMFTVDADHRQQEKVVRRLLIQLFKLLIEVGFEEILVVAVGGNHGEMRVDGKAVTTFADNKDVAVFEQVYDAISETEHADRFAWRLPLEDLVITADVADRVVGWTHGHLAKVPGATPQKKLQTWWEKQSLSMDSPVRDAHLLVTSHYHHFSAVEYPRVHLQTPAMCGSSVWWKGMSGQGSVPGTLTFVVEPGHERPFRHLEIISPGALP